jgi:hypothetical protein
MPRTLWKWIAENGKYNPCPNRNASIPRSSSHTRRSNPPNTLVTLQSTRQSYRERPEIL